MDPVTTSLVQNILAPAAMTAAAGLMLIPANARLGATLSAHWALVELRAHLLAAPPADDVTDRHVHARRLDRVGERLHQSDRRVSFARCTLIALLVSVVFMLLSSACIGARYLVGDLSIGAGILFALGGLAMGIAMLTSMIEICGYAGRMDPIVETAPPTSLRTTTA